MPAAGVTRIEVARRIAGAADRPIDDRRVRVLVTTYFGALLMAGMGHLPYPDVPAFVAEAVKRLTQLRVEHGVKSFVDPCPIELGRDAGMMKEIAEKSEMNVVCTTGFYFEEMGLPIYWRHRTVEEIAELYIREIEKGIGTTGSARHLAAYLLGADMVKNEITAHAVAVVDFLPEVSTIIEIASRKEPMIR